MNVVMNSQYREETGEAYFPGECEAFGFNEVGGLKYEDGKWVDHCHNYRDNLEASD